MKLASLFALPIAVVSLSAAQAQTPPSPHYPAKMVTLVVPYAAGGFADTRARKIGDKLSKALKVPVIIDNKSGAGGVLGTNVVAKSPPDGATIGGNLTPLSVFSAPEVRERLTQLGMSLPLGTPEDFGKFVAKESDR